MFNFAACKSEICVPSFPFHLFFVVWPDLNFVQKANRRQSHAFAMRCGGGQAVSFSPHKQTKKSLDLIFYFSSKTTNKTLSNL